MTDHIHALPPGHRLREYRLERVLGRGGFGITYYAWDENLDKPVAVKEYLPNDYAVRADATTVRPRSTSDAENYQWGLDRFLEEARMLARFDHPHVNKVHRCFEANGTAYLVLEYIEGETLSALLERKPRLEEARLRRLLEELLSGLEEVHKAGFVHRDIKPGNIILRVDESAVLLDFGAARQLLGQRSQSITSVLTPGYAPIDQYANRADDVGPWSDLYALGMVAYRCISGLKDGDLPDAVSRSRLARKGERDLRPAVEIGRGRYAEDLLEAVDWSIKVNEDDRPQSVAALREALDEAPLPESGRKKPGKWIAMVFAGLLAVAGEASGWWFLVGEREAVEDARRAALAEARRQLQACRWNLELTRMEPPRVEVLEEQLEAAERELQATQEALQEVQSELQQCTEALVKKFLLVVISWDSRDDVDLHVIDPQGNEFYYEKRSYPNTEAKLEEDNTRGPGNEIWLHPRATPGQYRIYYKMFDLRTAGASIRGAILTPAGRQPIPNHDMRRDSEKRLVAVVTVDNNGDATLQVQ